MSEQLSPQGYLIGLDPKSTHPFWDGDTPTPSTDYTISAYPLGGHAPIKIGNLAKDQYTYYTSASWLGYPITRESILTDWYIYQDKEFRINARSSLDPEELIAVYEYYDMLDNMLSVNEGLMQECLELYMIGLVDGVSQNLIESRYGELGQTILDRFTEWEIPDNVKGYKLILVNNSDPNEPLYLYGYTLYFDEVKPSVIYTAEGKTVITEAE